MPFQSMRPDWRNDPRALGLIAQLMQTNTPIEAVLNPRDGLTLEGPKQAQSWTGEQFNVGPSYWALTLDGYQALIRWDDDNPMPAPFFAPIDLRPMRVDDYTTLRLDDLHELYATRYHQEFRYTVQDSDTEDTYYLDCVDSLIHCLRADEATPAKSVLPSHLELPAWIVWYMQFVPFQRQATLRLGERFLMTHVLNTYQLERGRPV